MSKQAAELASHSSSWNFSIQIGPVWSPVSQKGADSYSAMQENSFVHCHFLP
jgi:hypothetical protein